MKVCDENCLDKVELGEIVYCDLTVNHKGKTYILKKVVYKNNGELFFQEKPLKKYNIKVPVKIESISIIKRMGFENKKIIQSNLKRKEIKFTKSEEKRNQITGAYE